MEQKNTRARFISYYVWKVPKGSSMTQRVAFNPVKVCGGSAVVDLPVAFDFKRGAKDWLLGSEYSVRVRLFGVDEIGRHVTTIVGL